MGCALLVLLLVGDAKADPANCEDCFLTFPEGPLLDACLDAGNCNEVPVDGNVWLLAIVGGVFAIIKMRGAGILQRNRK